MNYLRILCQELLRISDSFVQENTERMVCQLVTRTAVFTGIHDLALTRFTSSCCSEYLVSLKESMRGTYLKNNYHILTSRVIKDFMVQGGDFVNVSIFNLFNKNERFQ